MCRILPALRARKPTQRTPGWKWVARVDPDNPAKMLMGAVHRNDHKRYIEEWNERLARIDLENEDF